jgi:desulfoferrodoxin (superoxide reductase-like protein)
MKTIIKITLISLLFLVCYPVFAHSPSDIQISFDKASKILTINVMHNVEDPTDHYIRQIKVSLNVQNVITQNFSSQTDTNGQKASYIFIDAAPGDQIMVTAICNLGGFLDKTLEVQE